MCTSNHSYGFTWKVTNFKHKCHLSFVILSIYKEVLKKKIIFIIKKMRAFLSKWGQKMIGVLNFKFWIFNDSLNQIILKIIWLYYKPPL